MDNPLNDAQAPEENTEAQANPEAEVQTESAVSNETAEPEAKQKKPFFTVNHIIEIFIGIVVIGTVVGALLYSQGGPSFKGDLVGPDQCPAGLLWIPVESGVGSYEDEFGNVIVGEASQLGKCVCPNLGDYGMTIEAATSAGDVVCTPLCQEQNPTVIDIKITEMSVEPDNYYLSDETLQIVNTWGSGDWYYLNCTIPPEEVLPPATDTVVCDQYARLISNPDSAMVDDVPCMCESPLAFDIVTQQCVEVSCDLPIEALTALANDARTSGSAQSLIEVCKLSDVTDPLVSGNPCGDSVNDLYVAYNTGMNEGVWDEYKTILSELDSCLNNCDLNFLYAILRISEHKFTEASQYINYVKNRCALSDCNYVFWLFEKYAEELAKEEAPTPEQLAFLEGLGKYYFTLECAQCGSLIDFIKDPHFDLNEFVPEVADVQPTEDPTPPNEAIPPAEGTLQFFAPQYSVDEDGGTQVISVTRLGGSDGEVSVDYVSADITATAGDDYESVKGTLTWADGDDIRKTFIVPLIGDNVLEENETLNLILGNVTGGAIIGDPSITEVILTDNDGSDTDGPPPLTPGSLQFLSAQYNVDETGGTVNIVVNRFGGSDGEVSVDYVSTDSTATAGDDYTAVNDTITWADGDANKMAINVPILDDSIVEGDEIFTLTLSNATGGATIVNPSITTVTITGEDEAVVYNIINKAYAQSEFSLSNLDLAKMSDSDIQKLLADDVLSLVDRILLELYYEFCAPKLEDLPCTSLEIYEPSPMIVEINTLEKTHTLGVADPEFTGSRDKVGNVIGDKLAINVDGISDVIEFVYVSTNKLTSMDNEFMLRTTDLEVSLQEGPLSNEPDVITVYGVDADGVKIDGCIDNLTIARESTAVAGEGVLPGCTSLEINEVGPQAITPEQVIMYLNYDDPEFAGSNSDGVVIGDKISYEVDTSTGISHYEFVSETDQILVDGHNATEQNPVQSPFLMAALEGGPAPAIPEILHVRAIDFDGEIISGCTDTIRIERLAPEEVLPPLPTPECVSLNIISPAHGVSPLETVNLLEFEYREEGYVDEILEIDVAVTEFSAVTDFHYYSSQDTIKFKVNPEDVAVNPLFTTETKVYMVGGPLEGDKEKVTIEARLDEQSVEPCSDSYEVEFIPLPTGDVSEPYVPPSGGIGSGGGSGRADNYIPPGEDTGVGSAVSPSAPPTDTTTYVGDGGGIGSGTTIPPTEPSDDGGAAAPISGAAPSEPAQEEEGAALGIIHEAADPVAPEQPQTGPGLLIYLVGAGVGSALFNRRKRK